MSSRVSTVGLGHDGAGLPCITTRAGPHHADRPDARYCRRAPARQLRDGLEPFGETPGVALLGPGQGLQPSATSSKPSSRAVRAKPGYISVYS